MPVVQYGTDVADVLDPIPAVAMQDLRLQARDPAIGVWQRQGGVVGASQGAPTLIEATDQRPTHQLIVQRDALQNEGRHRV